MSTPSRTTRRLWALALIASSCAVVGCKTWDSWDWHKLQGPGLSESSNWSDGVRPPSGGNRPAGLSRMAQDIEKNLGYY